MKTEFLRTTDDVEKCADLYIGSYGEHPLIDRETSIKSLYQGVRQQDFVKIIRLDGDIAAWLWGALGKMPHFKESVFQQKYYASCLTGIKACRALSLLHREMVDFAILKTRANFCLSNGSPFDTSCVLARVLSKDGWTQMGNSAYLDLRVEGGGRAPPWARTYPT